MMRGYNFFIIFIATIASAQSQVSLDSSEFPIVGTSYGLNNVAFINVPPVTAPGPGQAYDFTGGFTYGAQLIQYDDATLSPFSSYYPSATLSRYIPGVDLDQYFYYTTDASGFWQNGMAWVINVDTFYFNYNSPNEDTILSNKYIYGYSDSMSSVSKLSVSFGPDIYDSLNHYFKQVDADGWGTMNIGAGIFDSVLRVHVTEYRFDSVYINGGLISANLVTSEYHLYYLKGVRHPLVKYYTDPFIEVVGLDTTFYYIAEILNLPPPPIIILGCTDSSAVNYNPLANEDDGSCVICAPISYTITPDTYICEGSNISLNATGGTSYLWSTGETTPAITVNPVITTTYSVLINSGQYCWVQATIQITVYNDAVSDFWNATPHITDTTNFVNLSFAATDYFWDFGDGNTSTAENPSNYYGSLGTYTVMLVASNACSVDTLTTTIDVVLDIPDLSNEVTGFRVVPNPGKRDAKVVFSLGNSQELSLVMLDVLGREITIFRNRIITGGNHEFDIGEYVKEQQAGIYFLKLTSEKSQAYFKWIKQ